MSQPPAGVDEIKITVMGTQKFRQKIMDLVYAALMDENLQFPGPKAGNEFSLESTIESSEEVEP